MDQETPKQRDPDDRSAMSAADVELDRRLNELRHEFQDDRHALLDKRAESINWWLAVMAIVLTFFGIVVAVAGFISFERFRVLEKETTNRVEQLVDKIKDLAVEAEQDAGIIRRITAQYADDFPKIASEVADETIENPKALLLDKAIARAVSFQQQSKRPQAIEMWRAVALVAEGRDNKQAANAWFSVGYLSQDPDASILAYDQAIRLRPDLAEAYNNRGNAKSGLQQYKDAIADYDKALRLKADYAEAYYNRGLAKNDLKQYKDAIADYDKALRLKADYAEAYYNRGLAKNDLKQYKDAIADYDKALRLKADYAEAYYNRGHAKIDLRQYKDAIADYDEAIRLKPDFAEAYNNRGKAKVNFQQYKGALADFDEALRLKADYAGAYYNRGHVRNDLKQYKDAIADFDQAIRLNPDLAIAYYSRGLAKKALGLRDETRKDFETALELARNANNEEITAQAVQSLRDLDKDGGS